MSSTGNYYYHLGDRVASDHNKMILRLCDSIWTLILNEGNLEPPSYFQKYSPLMGLPSFKLYSEIYQVGDDSLGFSVIRIDEKPDIVTASYYNTDPVTTYSINAQDLTYSMGSASRSRSVLEGRKIEDLERIVGRLIKDGGIVYE